MNDNYFIAWHPESGYLFHHRFEDNSSLTLDKFKSSWVGGGKELLEIRQVRIIDEEAVRKLWEKLEHMRGVDNEDPWTDGYHTARNDIDHLLQSILPQPTEGK